MGIITGNLVAIVRPTSIQDNMMTAGWGSGAVVKAACLENRISRVQASLWPSRFKETECFRETECFEETECFKETECFFSAYSC